MRCRSSGLHLLQSSKPETPFESVRKNRSQSGLNALLHSPFFSSKFIDGKCKLQSHNSVLTTAASYCECPEFKSEPRKRLPVSWLGLVASPSPSR
jgi:hypothetical protein